MVGSSDRPVARLPGIAQAPRCEGHPVLAYNVQCLPTRREPTARAAKACPPPRLETDNLTRGGKARSADAVNACWRMWALSINKILSTAPSWRNRDHALSPPQRGGCR
jgi:hypothetical protein